jgi:cell wall-active antibiotic response 4TMS protein YvqF
LIVIGVLLLLRNLGYLPASLDQWWPAILIFIGLWILFVRSAPGEAMPPKGPLAPSAGQAPTAEGRRHAATGGLILVGLGLALLASNLLGGRSAGALIMIAVGLALLISRIW